MPTTTHRRAAVRAMYAGLLLTVAALVVPYADRASGGLLADHLREGYPTYSADRIASAVDLWLVILTTIGALGIAGWLGAIRVARAGKRSAPWIATSLFVVGTTLALTVLLIKDTSGDSGLPTTLGLVGLLPCAAGLIAVVSLWRA